MTKEEKKFIKSTTILAIESLWFRNLTMPKYTIQPILEMLYNNTRINYAYFTANTREELKFVLSKFNNNHPGIIYIASHGNTGKFFFGTGNEDYLTIAELGNFLKGKLRNRAIHIGSCETFNISESDILRFKYVTKASLVSGYTKSVDWLESSALDMLYLEELQRNSKNLNRFKKEFLTRYSQMAELNGLLIYV